MSQEHEPYGDEWKAEMMKKEKSDIIDMLKRSRLQLDGYAAITEWVEKEKTIKF